MIFFPKLWPNPEFNVEAVSFPKHNPKPIRRVFCCSVFAEAAQSRSPCTKMPPFGPHPSEAYHTGSLGCMYTMRIVYGLHPAPPFFVHHPCCVSRLFHLVTASVSSCYRNSSSFGNTAKRQMSIIETNSDNLARSSQQGLKHRRINGKGDVPRKKDKIHNFEEYECAAATKRAIRFRGRCLCILFRFQVDTWEEAVAVLEAIGRVPSSLSPSASCPLQSSA